MRVNFETEVLERKTGFRAAKCTVGPGPSLKDSTWACLVNGRTLHDQQIAKEYFQPAVHCCQVSPIDTSNRLCELSYGLHIQLYVKMRHNARMVCVIKIYESGTRI